MPGAHAPAEVRFWRHVRKTDGCWEWTGSRNRDGYGTFKAIAGAAPTRASRFMWELTFGAIPEGLLACHHCDNPPCVRPDHLFLGTHQHNVRDMIRKGRRVIPPTAATRSRAKLSPATVALIRGTYSAGGISMRQLAEQYGVNKSNIVRAINGIYWRDVPAG